jgi:uncharacterized phage protein (TIGR01671 family)
MSREIKFRAWDDPTGCCGIGPVGMSYNARPDCDADAIMQFTGVLDKNGKEIYEGDIIIAKDYPFYGDEACEAELNYVGEVFWDEEGLRWYYEMHVVSNRVRGAACGDVLCNQKHDDKTSSDWEVVGNIYENPELLTP